MGLIIPFDQPGSTARYEIALDVENSAEGDGIVLVGNREAFLALAKVFEQLAKEESAEGTHLHLGYTETEPQGPGWRISVHPLGRVDNTESR